MTPKCVVCGKPITWSFYVCADCEAEHGKRKDERPEWLTYLINDERRLRHSYLLSIRRNNLRIDDCGQDSNGDDLIEFDTNFSYSFDPDALIEYKIYYGGWMIKSSDGEFIELQDSDWDHVFTHSV